jgi:RND family efflux transporter MFP subunit
MKFLIMALSLVPGLACQPVFAQEDEGLDCLLEPNMRIDISAAVPGVLDEVLVQRGDRVKSGQLLATLVSGPEQAAVELAKARVEFGKRKAVRNEELFKKKMISMNEKDEMDTEIQISRLQLKQVEEQLKLRKILSPIDGIVIERDKDPGEYVETEPLLTVVNLDPLNVEAVAPADLFGSIKKGMHGKVKVLGPKSNSYDATVVLTDKVIDAASGTIRVRLALPNPKNAIPAGRRCFVEIR